MDEVIGHIICFSFIILAIKGSISSLIEHRDLRYPFNRMLYYISILVSFLLINYNLNTVLSTTIKMSLKYTELSTFQNNLLRMFLLIGIFFIVHFIIYTVLKVVFSVFHSGRMEYSKTSVLIATVFGCIKGAAVILIMFIGIVIFNSTAGEKMPIMIFDNIRGYSDIEKIISKNFTSEKNVITYNDTDEYAPASNVLIYYNGVTLDEGVKSNDEIDEKAVEITKYKERDIEKARSIYVWIGSNIEYDFDKAYSTLNSGVSGESGAIEAWYSRRGICFDYACLYVAMARAAGLNVRLITGSAYDGSQYGPHAWNEVYIKDESRWITVDSTFYMAGDYFDNDNFYDDHVKENIAGEW